MSVPSNDGVSVEPEMKNFSVPHANAELAMNLPSPTLRTKKKTGLNSACKRSAKHDFKGLHYQPLRCLFPDYVQTMTGVATVSIPVMRRTLQWFPDH